MFHDAQFWSLISTVLLSAVSHAARIDKLSAQLVGIAALIKNIEHRIDIVEFGMTDLQARVGMLEKAH